MGHNTQLGEEIRKHQDAIVKDWMAYQMSSLTLRRDLVKESELRSPPDSFWYCLEKLLPQAMTPRRPIGRW